MIKRFPQLVMGLSITLLILVVVGLSQEQVKDSTTQAPPPVRKIPGITAEDQFPHACVDCHINRPDMNMDVRLSTHMKEWNNKVDPALLAKAQECAPTGLTLKGKHPIVTDALKNIPAGCLKCHGKASTEAPPFSRMLHLIHLSGGEKNHFLTMFQGECTHCHKLNMSTGKWSLPSGPEK
jgi:hypothetical protein